MSSLGNNVTMIEKITNNETLTDAKKNFDKNIKSIFNDISMRLGDCLSFIRDTAFRFDYLYFDFMFNVNKSAYPQKETVFKKDS